MSQVRRRQFLLTTGALLATPLAANAQQPTKVPRIGFLGYGPAAGFARHLASMRRGLEQFGYVEGKNLIVEYRFAEDDERIARLAEELVRMDLRVIVTAASTPAVAKLTRRIPIVQATGPNLVEVGLAASYARPGRNVTGLAQRAEQGLVRKQVELAKAIAPGAATIGVMVSPSNTLRERHLSDARSAGSALGATVVPLVVATAAEVESLPWRKERCDALAVLPDLFLYWFRRRLVELVGKVPAVYPFREFVEDGGIVSYGPDLLEAYGRVASFVDRLLKGAKPEELPIELSSRFELVVNRKAASALGIAIPPPVLVRADEVIE
jgi:putative tryptophan/tyrosine transport system substrate-binding protein